MNRILIWLRQRGSAEALLLAMLVCIGYGSTLRVSFLSDDFVLLTAAQLTHALGTIFAIDPNWFFYRPLGGLLWFAEYHAFGYHAVFYHAISVGMHWTSSVLVVLLVRRLAPDTPALGLMAGASWALYPLDMETVAWLAAQYDLLATMFVLAALACLLQGWQHGGWGWYALAWVCYQFGLWSKESAFMLPLLAVLLAWCLPQRPSMRQIVRGVAPCLALLGINLMQRYATWGNIGGYTHDHPFMFRLVGQLLAETTLVLIAPLNQLLVAPAVRWIWLIVFGALLFGVAARPRWRVLLFAGGWITLTLVPVFGSLPVGADLQNSRVLYLPAIGFCLALAELLHAITQRVLPRFRRRAMVAASVLVLAAYAAVLLIQVQPWIVAGQQTAHIAQELHRLIAGFPPGSQVQIVGMPDNYQGAYVFRLGLNHAFAHLYQATFPIEEQTTITPFSYNHPGNSYQVAFAFDPSVQSWGIASARWVSAPGLPMVTGNDWKDWNLGPCGGSGWISDPPMQCSAAGSTPRGASWLDSPPLQLDGTKWLEIQIVAAPAQANEAIQIQWAHTTHPDWARTARQAINLPRDGTTRVYHFFVQPDGSQQPVRALRVSAAHAGGLIVVDNVAVRQVP